jgi:glycerol kinase
VRPAEVAAIGITNQRETTVIWERRTGRPIANAIVWQDTRTAGLCAELARIGGQDRYRQRTGLPLATYFSGPKIKWLLDNVPGARQRAQNGELLFGTIDTWLIWNATGQHVTDVTNASRTLLMNLETLDWDDEILAELGIPRVMLPRIASSSEVYGRTRDGIPVAGDMGDQQAALFGQACFTAGEAKNTYGTGCFLLMNTGPAPVHSRNGLLTTLGYKLGAAPPVYALEGSIAITGALVQWLRDNLGLIEKSADIEALARSVEDNGGIYFVPAFSGLYAPYWKDNARGVIIGLTRYVNKGHLARAALEATAYQTRDVLDAMNRDIALTSHGAPGLAALKSLKVDGGMVHNELLMQFQADILNVPVIRPKVSETTALGAAYAAGLAVGYWSDLEALRANWAVDKIWQPRMDAEARERLYRGWQKAVTRTFDWLD